jgi:hypothetical protein
MFLQAKEGVIGRVLSGPWVYRTRQAGRQHTMGFLYWKYIDTRASYVAQWKRGQ